MQGEHGGQSADETRQPDAAPASQTSAGGTADARADAPRASAPGALRRGAARSRRWLNTFLTWPAPGVVPVPTVTSLFLLAFAIVVIVEFLPMIFSDVTLSVHAQTEIVELELDPDREHVWWLPAGSYSLVTATRAERCEAHGDFDIGCEAQDPSAVVIRNGATVRLETLAPETRGQLLAALAGKASESDGARFRVAITPRATPPADGDADSGDKTPVASTAADAARLRSSVEIRDGPSSVLAASHDLVIFESLPVEVWRTPLILQKVEIGAFLAENIAAEQTLGGFRQPIMTAGDVRIFARFLGSSERYQVLEERFDPADIVQIPADSKRTGLLLGLITLEAADRRFALTLHTDLDEIFVRRLGAEHKVGVSMWAILSKLPAWLALWVLLASMIFVSNYYNARTNALRGRKHAAQD